MKKKIDIFINNYKDGHFSCPMCSCDLHLLDKSLKCANSHTFDINRKGYVKLLKKFKPYKEEIYDKKLFEARRKIINRGFYDNMHDSIAQIINSTFKKPVNAIDIGSGEGTHSKCIKNKIRCGSFYLTDLSTDAIEISSDFIRDNMMSIVCDAYNLPFNKIFDVALDILSPFCYDQVYKILKDDGIIIKVIPTQNYLKEIRKSNNIKDYENEDNVVNNFKKHFTIIQETIIENTFNIDSEMAKHFLEMTPLTSKVEDKKLKDKITISLRIVVGRKK